MSTKIKFCGITNLEDIENSVSLGVDYLGFNFYPKSPRYLEWSNFVSLINQVQVKKFQSVAVLADPDYDFVQKIIDSKLIDILQFHGLETPEFCSQFSEQIKTWKVLTINSESTFKSLEKQILSYSNIDRFLLDTEKNFIKSNQFEALEIYRKLSKNNYPLALAGGINPENIAFYISELHPEIIDVASGIESSPGKKDPQKMREFVENTLL